MSRWTEDISKSARSIAVPYKIETCDTTKLSVPYLANNTIFTLSGAEVGFICKVNGTVKQLTLKEWQSYGLNIGIATTLDVQTIIE